MAFSGMINVKTGLLTLGGQFEAYKRGQLERNIQTDFTTVKSHLYVVSVKHHPTVMVTIHHLLKKMVGVVTIVIHYLSFPEE